MADRYQQLVNTPIGKLVSKQVGLPAPPRLERYRPGQPVITGPVLLGAAAAAAGSPRSSLECWPRSAPRRSTPDGHGAAHRGRAGRT